MPDTPIPAIDAFIRRNVPDHADRFHYRITGDDATDRFTITTTGDTVLIEGSTTRAITYALGCYLRDVEHQDISWDRGSARLSPTPPAHEPITGESPYPWRYYFNYVTFGYSTGFWDWERWEREIDWMALHGVSMPLAVTGQEAAWHATFTRLGLSQADLDEFFTGPAYFPWGWMGCTDAWAGPIPDGWIDDHVALQQQILERERSLGMQPVLQGFAGHVPQALRRMHPDSKYHDLNWTDFTDTLLLDPQDPLFQDIGTVFMEEQTRLYGTDHLYAADPFIEMEPQEGDPAFLDRLAKAMLAGMTTADPNARWVFQAWPFYFQKDYWTPERIEAFLTAVPDDRMIVLDLWAEHLPLWKQTNAFHGKPWLWCMVHNFGGRQGMQGDLETIASGPANAGNHPDSGDLSGVGITSETIENNPLVYNLLLDTAWSTDPIDLDTWLPAAIRQRYGTDDPKAQSAWQRLRESVYSREDPSVSVRHKSICQRPNRERMLGGTIDHHVPQSEIAALVEALDLLLEVTPSPEQQTAYERDLVDIGHQLIGSRAVSIHEELTTALRENDAEGIRAHGKRLVEAIHDLDRLSATHAPYLLGTWLENAARWGRSDADRKHLAYNALMLVTQWSDPDNYLLNDYSGRTWSGLLGDYHAERWRIFLDAPNDPGMEERLQAWETGWIESVPEFPTETRGNTREVARELLRKWA